MRGKIAACIGTVPSQYVTISPARQRLSVVKNGDVGASYPVSTSRFGIGNREGSFMTPPGVHRIAEKIGDGARPGTVFRDRLDTGEVWDGRARADNLILTRILRLEGLEDGINRGPGIGSFERYIYIHGTDKEESIGTPISHGCVCMRNADVIALYNTVEVGTIVVID
ncbi:MAG: L,D-transpeptidase family protein [Chitinivibrionales bacterium]|nr:L,D-transpeptidase family protein [Chitinivibrionales bacterium]MBD3396025.1 L,D-transpeptidase family protein [Chitinivibrionales bacterium]